MSEIPKSTFARGAKLASLPMGVAGRTALDWKTSLWTIGRSRDGANPSQNSRTSFQSAWRA